MVRYGLKVWSTNRDLFDEARANVESGNADFVELYTVPGNTDPKTLAAAFHDVPVSLHGPHENHGFNLHTLTPAQIRSFRAEVSATADALHAPLIVIHGGVGTEGRRFAANLRLLGESRIVLENMPKDALGGGTCYGYSLEQLRDLNALTHGTLCIDLGHAIKSAVSQNVPYRNFLTSIVQEFRPSYFHLSDGDGSTGTDEHRELSQGSYDLPWIAGQLRDLSQDREISVVLEVPKAARGLGNDLRSIEFLRRLITKTPAEARG